MQIELSDVVLALSDAIDLVGIDDDKHGKRVGVMAADCAHELGWSEREQVLMLNAGLLHDCGVSSTRVHHHLVSEFDWQGSQEHCLRGEALLKNVAPLAHLAEIVRYHHTHWCDLPTGLDRATALAANLIFLVDRVDALTAAFYGAPDYLLKKESSRLSIAEHSGQRFAPELIEAFLSASKRESFWLNLEPRYLAHMLPQRLGREAGAELGLAAVRSLAMMFSAIVDAKSPFTAEHSEGVARLAFDLARVAGLDAETCARIEIAGLLHDIGKLRVADEILEKPGPLDAGQRAAIMRHSYETYQILGGIRGLEEIALWAASHHEKLDGSGYPFHLGSDELPLASRIIAVADVCQALVQDRPYRKPLGAENVLDYLHEQRKEGHLDGDVIALLERDSARSFALARCAQAA
ncbi:HD-GYP domain-containing protein [Niveibacterium terrae]|uniref:HD-GYP domain-containing protein n=1 Tax=Niveibacterium terrae TaxID=3373598 RepID=UPI003A8F66F4